MQFATFILFCDQWANIKKDHQPYEALFLKFSYGANNNGVITKNVGESRLLTNLNIDNKFKYKISS